MDNYYDNYNYGFNELNGIGCCGWKEERPSYNHCGCEKGFEKEHENWGKDCRECKKHDNSFCLCCNCRKCECEKRPAPRCPEQPRRNNNCCCCAALAFLACMCGCF